MLTVSADDLQQTFGFRAPHGYKPRYNIAPSQPVLTLTSESGLLPRELIWGLVPSESPDSSWSRRMINARSESVATKTSFRSSFERRRCLVIIDGYYEWQAADGARKPHRICLQNHEPFTVAAIWDRWGTGEHALESCAILTTSAAPSTAAVHDRMPVIISERDRGLWLDTNTSLGDLNQLMVPYEQEELQTYEVSALVNSPANDLPACIEPFTAMTSLQGPRPSSPSRRRNVSSEVLDLFQTPEAES
jgi:putative SOS response-associated peptidase YedK